MNRVTDFLPAVSFNNESRENLSHANDCLESPFFFLFFFVVTICLPFPFCLLFRGKGTVIDAYRFWFHSGDSPKLVSIKNNFILVTIY